MEDDTKKILSCLTLDKRMAGRKSTNLEKLCFVKSMKELKDKTVNVAEVVSDVHMQITSVMSKCYILNYNMLELQDICRITLLLEEGAALLCFDKLCNYEFVSVSVILK